MKGTQTYVGKSQDHVVSPFSIATSSIRSPLIYSHLLTGGI